MDKQRLKIFNKAVFEEERFTSQNRFSLQLTMGLFKGNEILFVGQNPGVHNCKQKNYCFEMYQLVYQRKFHHFKLGVYILKVIKELRLNVNDISFTNVIKYATLENRVPVSEYNDKFEAILERQIKLIKPKKIVAIGKFASAAIDNIGFGCIYMMHPASHYYSNNFVRRDARLIKDSPEECI